MYTYSCLTTVTSKQCPVYLRPDNIVECHGRGPSIEIITHRQSVRSWAPLSGSFHKSNTMLLHSEANMLFQLNISVNKNYSQCTSIKGFTHL